MRDRHFARLFVLLGLFGISAGCGNDSGSPTSPSNTSVSFTAPTTVSPSEDAQLDTLRPTLSVRNGSSNQTGSRTYEFQISDTEDFAASSASFITSYRVMLTKTGVPEGAAGTTSYTPEEDLQPTTRFYWRARVAQGSSVSAWSDVAKFRTRLVGYLRAGELYDPLIHGETVGRSVGSTEFVVGKGIRLAEMTSYVRYHLPRTVEAGEFSMEVEGLRANGPGNKTKVFGMQDGQTDFISNRYRVDAQYRGASGSPPNCIQWRAMFGSNDERIEPPMAKRYASVFRLDSSRTYYWKGVWSDGFRLTVLDGGITGSPLYDYGITAPYRYSPRDHYAYLGAPLGRSGPESASIPGAIYRNVWLGEKPRPESLGSALRAR